ncbi:MAG: hypothetical protein OEU50_01470 [Gammaproteobacteria bacterium]|nr:hypothetical protein [Gammaproteobacteria bacterium]
MTTTRTALRYAGIGNAMTFYVYLFLAICFVYAGAVSYLAFRESGKKWMLYLPQWIDASSGVSRSLRRHGMIAFALLFVAMILFFYTTDQAGRP